MCYSGISAGFLAHEMSDRNFYWANLSYPSSAFSLQPPSAYPARALNLSTYRIFSSEAPTLRKS